MESNLSFFSLPFIDNADVDFTLPSHGSLLGADDVLAQFLSGDELLEEPDLNGSTKLHCEICRKQFDNAKKYYGHLRVHSKDNVWICDKCPNEKFSTKQQLMKHSVTHKPLERMWRCPQCDMSFGILSRLQQHLFAKHSDYRPHKCDRCEMAFHKLSDLKKHKNIHENIKKHACTLCPMHFNDPSNLKRHMVCHSSEKPYPCPGCGTRYTQIASMKRHNKKCVTIKKENGPVNKNTLIEHGVREHEKPLQNEPNVNKSTELHVDVYRSINNNHHINIDPTHTTHLETHSNTNTNLVNLNNNQLYIDSNPIANIANNMNLNINSPLNILTNPVNINTIPANIHTHSNIDRNQTVENIVDDILSAEDDYLIRHPMSNQLLNYNQPDEPEPENHDNLINQMELMKEMNQMHILDDELLGHDLDFDSFQTMCNTNDMDYTDRNELLFDIPDGRSMDQDIMNALYQVRGDIPDLLNEPEILNTTEKDNDFLANPAVSVNECATIFESDVDLEASTNLAANLNQLIGENNVQYISTEHDDTFIISLNSEIDAEQLTDMLNIGVGSTEDNDKTVEEIAKEVENIEPAPAPQPIVVTIENASEHNIAKSLNQPVTQPISVKIKPATEKENKEPDVPEETPKIVKVKQRVYYVCRKCNKIFNKKDNYKSHRATHEPSLRRHVCRVCSERFSYRSSLNKHVKRLHTPQVVTAHACNNCNKTYQAAWMLKRHMARDHESLLPFHCTEKDCGKRFYKQADLNVHLRFHRNERPYSCRDCDRSFHLMSHLNRHIHRMHDK